MVGHGSKKYVGADHGGLCKPELRGLVCILSVVEDLAGC